MADLDDAADQLLALYATDRMRSYLTVLFPNSAYVNPTMGVDKKEQFVAAYVRAYRSTTNIGVACVFTGNPAQTRIYRQHLPLITGEGLFNFLPQGTTGLPVSGIALLCIQAMPLGTLRSQGRALLVHSDRNEMTFDYAREFFQLNQKAELLQSMYGPTGPSPRSVVIERLAAIQTELAQEAMTDLRESVTAYHFTNYGTNADVTIHHLPSFVIRFLREVRTLRGWNNLVGHYWAAPDKKSTEPNWRRNELYEAMFDLPDNAGYFVRRFLLGRVNQGTPGPRAGWDIVELFLKEVVNMESHRVLLVKGLGDKLADYIDKRKDLNFFGDLYRCRQFGLLRSLLLRAERNSLISGNEPIIRFDEVIEIFQLSEADIQPDWRLAWDLVLIRLIEVLYEQKILGTPEARAQLEQAQAELGVDEQAEEIPLS